MIMTALANFHIIPKNSSFLSRIQIPIKLALTKLIVNVIALQLNYSLQLKSLSTTNEKNRIFIKTVNWVLEKNHLLVSTHSKSSKLQTVIFDSISDSESKVLSLG